MTAFQDLSISKELLSALSVQGITAPTNIQLQCYPHILNGRDVIACSGTGTGKTLAYLLPLFSKLDFSGQNVQGLILVPTQELAVQVHQQIELLFSNAQIASHSVFVIGEGNISRQIDSLKTKPSIVVGTPSRTAQLIRMKKLRVHAVQTLVLDEADKLIGKSYIESILFIRKCLMKRTQILMFSASIDKRTHVAASELMYQPVILDENTSGESRIPKNIKHVYVVSDRRERIETLRRLAKALNNNKTIIFINTKYDLEESLQKMKYHHYNVSALGGNIDKQEKRKAIDDFRNGHINYLLATDVAARGLQIDNIETVINVNLPEEAKDYLHRAGRCGRNGNDGLCISIVTENELSKIKKYQKDFHINIVQKRLYNGKLVAK